jgi:arabinofuranan 3-O-arabinosyltransferase
VLKAADWSEVGSAPEAPHAAKPGRALWWTFALVVYLPLVMIDRGKVSSDTKSYLYLDPSRLLTRATSMWDPQVGLGTVSHQNIGYLFPLGPYYWFTEQVLHLPPWFAQRLWLGTLLFAAGMGTRYLLRTLGVDGPGVPVAMLAYAFTPYVLEYSARLSVLLGPWAALPWFIAFTARALRTRGWRYPALFALTVQLVGSVNASSLAYALVGPAVFAVYAVLVTRESDWRRLGSAAWRTGVLTLVTSLWWLSGLLIESGYGLNVLRFTEQISDVSSTAYPLEVLRGLGYWLFYGRDSVNFWNSALPNLTRNGFVILVSLLIPAIAMLASATVRWRYRLFWVILVVIGVGISVGAAPYNHPSLVGAAFKSFAATSTLGLALRSTARATPLVVLGFAALLAAGINVFAVRMRAASRPGFGTGAAFVIGALCLVNGVGAWSGTYYSAYLERTSVPRYWQRALAAADAGPHDTRVLSVPGSIEATYTWGDTLDPVEPGLIDRPFVARELVPMGSVSGANLLQALDGRLQDGTLDADAVAPIARLMAVGDVVLRGDMQTDRFNLVPAAKAWDLFTGSSPKGLTAPQTYGNKSRGRSVPAAPVNITSPPTLSDIPPPVAIFGVENPEPIIRTKSANAPVVVAGDGEGLLDLASAGLLDPTRLILYSGSFVARPAALRALPRDSVLVLTDSNRRRAQRTVLSLASTQGYTETAGEEPLVADPHDQRLEVFPGETDASRTVNEMTGIASVQASGYGTDFGFSPAGRPAAAFDGDPTTGWQLPSTKGQFLVLGLTHPITTDHINFVQPKSTTSAYIRGISLRFDGGAPVRVSLDRSSARVVGQTVRFPRQKFSKLEIDVDSVHAGTALSGHPMGFAEIRVADDAPGAQSARAVETMRLPTDLLGTLGTASAGHPLVIVMSAETTMDDDAMRRGFTLPTDRTFSISGTAVLSKIASDDVIDRTLGLPDAAHGGVTATSTGHLDDARARASNAVDGDETTAWNTPAGDVGGQSIRVVMPTSRTVDHLDLQLTADARHSVATKIRVTGDDGSRVIDLGTQPFSADGLVDNVPVRFAPLHGRTLTVTVTDYEPLVVRAGAGFVLEPAGIAELGIPGIRRAPVPARLPDACLAGLFAIDGRPVSVRVRGTTADALRGRPLAIASCGASKDLTLGAGRHQLVSLLNPHNPANSSAFDLQRLALGSAAGGDAALAAGLMDTPTGATSPAVTIEHQSRTAMTLRVAASTGANWLVLGQSLNTGWHASINGHDLGAPQLVDGYANGWLIPPSASALTVHLRWSPQRFVWLALWLSLLGGIACVGIVIVSSVRRRARAADGTDSVAQVAPAAITSRTALLEAPIARTSTRSTLVPVATLSILAGLIVVPWVGVLVGVLTFWSMRDRRVRCIVRYAPAAIVGAIAISIAIAQAIHHYPTGGSWPAIFAWARIPVWIAIFLLLVDAVVDRTERFDEPAP